MSGKTADEHEGAGAAGGYLWLLARIWVDGHGEEIRGVIEDVRTGERLPVDVTRLVAFLRRGVSQAAYDAGRLPDEEPGDAPPE